MHIFEFYRELRQKSPLYVPQYNLWHIADYESVQQALTYLELQPSSPYPDAVQWVTRLESRLQSHFPDQTADFIRDVLEPLAHEVLASHAKRIHADSPAIISQLFSGTVTWFHLQQCLQTQYQITTQQVHHALTQLIQRELFIALIGNALLATLAYPKQAARLKVYPQYGANAVIETLRFNPPIHNLRYITQQAIRLDKVVIPAGQRVELSIAAANHDPLLYRNADVFDIKRRMTSPPLVAYPTLLNQQVVSDLLLYLFLTFRYLRLVTPYKPRPYNGKYYLRRVMSLHVAWGKPAKK